MLSLSVLIHNPLFILSGILYVLSLCYIFGKRSYDATLSTAFMFLSIVALFSVFVSLPYVILACVMFFIWLLLRGRKNDT